MKTIKFKTWDLKNPSFTNEFDKFKEVLNFWYNKLSDENKEFTFGVSVVLYYQNGHSRKLGDGFYRIEMEN